MNQLKKIDMTQKTPMRLALWEFVFSRPLRRDPHVLLNSDAELDLNPQTGVFIVLHYEVPYTLSVWLK